MCARPPFNSLPLRKEGPPGNAWGLFGEKDQCGMLNLLTPANTTAAAKEIQDGTRVSTDWFLEDMLKPGFNRQPFIQNIIHKAPRTVNDDVLTLNTQSSSQWDGFRHFGFQADKVFFNGATQEQIASSDVIGTHVWVEKGGIVGRGVLLDYAAWADANNITIEPFQTTPIPLSTLLKVAEGQGTTFRSGDILFIRTGWNRAYKALTDEEKFNLGKVIPPTSIGVQSSEETLRWIWENEFAAIAGDQPAFEAWPIQNPPFWMHEWLLAGWGLPIGELFDLEHLSQECKAKNRYTFFFSSVPLKIRGGVASPPNGVAIF